eukprot:gb/GECG01015183.1/.p1 GENE.gb/GECG01015183.1/~~gb/GECG01015183.1/.p1  ORF type:complete len:118 (+),score=7.50 gb/GECG01015183.1/:1-354(+)
MIANQLSSHPYTSPKKYNIGYWFSRTVSSNPTVVNFPNESKRATRAFDSENPPMTLSSTGFLFSGTNVAQTNGYSRGRFGKSVVDLPASEETGVRLLSRLHFGNLTLGERNCIFSHR